MGESGFLGAADVAAGAEIGCDVDSGAGCCVVFCDRRALICWMRSSSRRSWTLLKAK